MSPRFFVRVTVPLAFPFVARALLFSGALLLPFSPLPAIAQPPPVPHHPGHWTGLQNWSTEAVHMALLPGDGVNYHSKILWWHSSLANNLNLQGGLWGWKYSPAADTCGTSFGDFTSLQVNKAPFDVFCSGHTHMADGRLAVVGGTSSVAEGGIRNAAYFDPTQPAANAWRELGAQMEARRWYPTAQIMPQGEIIAYSGSSHSHMLAWGGPEVPGSTGDAKGDLHRLQIIDAGDWDDVIPFRTGTDWPSKRFGHSLVAQNPVATSIMFGGMRSDGIYLQDTWMLKADTRPFEADFFYFWEQTNINGLKPDASLGAQRGGAQRRQHDRLRRARRFPSVR